MELEEQDSLLDEGQEAQELPNASEASEQAKQEEAARIEPYLELLREVPDLQKSRVLPAEVMRRIAQGESPLNAYRAYENGRLKAELDSMRYRSAAPGSVRSTAYAAKRDSFSAGFDEGFLY